MDLLDMSSPDFNPDLYLAKCMKEYNISQLLEEEQNLYKKIQSLDSDMQTLVYENYNKFINATDTVRKMSSHFDKMEDELSTLCKNIEEVTNKSEQISSNLKGRREGLTKLSNTHSLLQKLQFLFDLSPQMKSCIESDDYDNALKFYIEAESALMRYRHFPSIQAIDEECSVLLQQLKEKLLQRFQDDNANQKQLVDTTELLLRLKEPPQKLAKQYLSCCERRLNSVIAKLQIDIADTDLSGTRKMDILEFVDFGCNNVVTELESLATNYKDIFIERFTEIRAVSQGDEDQLLEFLTTLVDDVMEAFLEKVHKRFVHESLDFSESAVFIRALDRVYRRLYRLQKACPSRNFAEKGFEIVSEAAQFYCTKSVELLKSKFADQITKTRHGIVSQFAGNGGSHSLKLSEMLTVLEAGIKEQLKYILNSLMEFTVPELSFCLRTKFTQQFGVMVLKAVTLEFLRHVLAVSAAFKRNTTSPPPQLILLLSRLCLDMENSMITYLISFSEESFNVSGLVNSKTINELRSEAKSSAQQLLDHFVRLEGQNISQMIKKSVETRDWLSTVEPRAVRSVMKRVVEDISDMDIQVGQLYEEGSRMDRSSESSRSRKTFSGIGLASRSYNRSNWNTYGVSSIDNSLISNIQKLFSEKIEIFSSVEFSKLSVISGVIKIGLKTFLECLRLATFSKFGLQQVQVDTYYLQTHLWRFVTDENLIHTLLEEVLVSCVHRCLDPVMMEMSVVEKICDGT